MLPLAAWADHSEGDSPEEPVETNDQSVQESEDCPLVLLLQASCGPVQTETHDNDGKPQCWVVVMDICNATHGNERNVVQDPSNGRIDCRVMDLVNIGLLQIVVSTLPAYDVENHDEAKDTKTGSTAPVDCRVSKEKVLDDIIVPSTHAETDVK